MKGKEEARVRRHLRIRKNVSGTGDRPRLSVHKSLNNFIVQIIDDTKGVTLVSASTLDKDIRGEKMNRGNAEMAKKIGKVIAVKAEAAGIKQVVFDRSGYLYHGCIKVLADSAREHGLEF